MQTFKRTLEFIRENGMLMVAVVIIGVIVFMLLALLAVLGSWLYGFWSNGLHGTHFEIGSCWQGLGAVITGLTGVFGLMKYTKDKYSIDSQFNSEEGEHPYKRGDSK